MGNSNLKMAQTVILFKIAPAILAMQKYLEEAVVERPQITAAFKYLCTAKITEAILNKIAVCRIFRLKSTFYMMIRNNQ